MALNLKYEITDIAHEEYPWLHRIRACGDLNDAVKDGELGGFVESEDNLSFVFGDTSWLYDDSIACGGACVDQNSVLKDKAIAKDKAYVSHGSVMSGCAIAEDESYVRGADLSGFARVSGLGMAVCSPDKGYRPNLEEEASVYGKVVGNYIISGSTIILHGEEIYNDSSDKLCIMDNRRSVIRNPERDKPHIKKPPQKKKMREQTR